MLPTVENIRCEINPANKDTCLLKLKVRTLNISNQSHGVLIQSWFFKLKEPGLERAHKEILMTSGVLETSIKILEQARDQIGLLVKPKK